VDVEAAVAERMDLLGQELDSFARVAENDRLRDLELVEQGRQAVQLLLLLQIRVVLRQPLQSQLVRRLYVLRLRDVLLLERFDLLRVGGTEQSDLRLGHDLNDLLDNFSKVLREQLVHFVKYQHIALVKVGYIFAT